MTPVTPSIEELLTEKDVAKIAKLSTGSIRRRRRLHQLPKWLKISAAVRYRACDVAAWLESHPANGGEEAR